MRTFILILAVKLGAVLQGDHSGGGQRDLH